MERTRGVLVLQVVINGLNVVARRLVRARARLGRGRGRERDADRRMVGLALRALALPRRPSPAWGDWGRVFDPVRLRRMAQVNGDILVRSVILQASFTGVPVPRRRARRRDAGGEPGALQFVSITAYALDGFAFAAEALVGRRHGRARPGRACGGRRMLASEWGVGMAAAAVGGVPGSAGPRLIDLMATAPEVRAAARELPAVGGGGAAGRDRRLDARRHLHRRHRDAGDAQRHGAVGAVYVAAVAVLLPRFGNHGLWASLMVLNATRGRHAGAALSGAGGAGRPERRAGARACARWRGRAGASRAARRSARGSGRRPR